ncbi:MAG: GNAT family N-acetyltransferase [Acidobacteriota bacterium]
MTSPSNYALLRDGGQLLIRSYDAADRGMVEALFGRLSAESLMFRFLTGGLKLDGRAFDVVTSGHALVGQLDGAVVGLASYAPLRDPTRAEMAIVVDDALHGRGIGTVLFERLARDAWAEGIRHFLAVVSGSNARMLDLLQRLGFRQSRTVEGGEVEVEVALKPDPDYLRAADARMHVAAAASLEPLFRPRAIAVVGPSRTRGTIGHETLRNLLASGFEGPVFPIHPHASSVAAVRAYPNARAVPDPFDLAVIVVPAVSVIAVARGCLEAGARALVVISAGFAEVGEEGRKRQAELLALCREHGARLVGPNCMGVLVHGPAGTINATFAPTEPPDGTVAVASQSGALGLAILEHARRLSIGVSSFVSMGNKADVSSNDLIERWEDDPATKVIVLYLESFGNPRRFARIARRVGAKKPIVVVKGGRSDSGRRAAASHTAALAGSEVAIGALFRQAGVMRCDTLEELCEVVTMLANQPLPAGPRVGIVTNAGGLGILCADACEAHGLRLPALGDGTRHALRAILPAEASVGNPVDMLASASGERYGQALRLLLDDPSVDAVIVLFVPPLVTQASDVAAALVAVASSAAERRKPVLACFMGSQGMPESLRGGRIPSYTFPEAAARALGHAAAYASWLRRPAGTLPAFQGVDRAAAATTIRDALAAGPGAWLAPDAAASVLAAYGIPTAGGVLVRSADDAALAARRLARPVAVKLSSRTVLHKTDVGGVHLDVRSPEAAAAAFRAIAGSLASRGLSDAFEGALVQPMMGEGVECLVGVVTDPIFGPLIGFGLGGILAEAMGDVAFRLHPLTDLDTDELIASTRAAKILAGVRGHPPADVAALRDLLLRVSLMVEDLPEIQELDVNPVLVGPVGQGAIALDARMRVARQA